ncbi:sensor histidine kinase [Spongiactinospora sp. TRM90649]|uniref:sensor histidine kinase n=1 Tax=Spongiactinospora sp. TRM90649 TaxID=3031114 RepID=UPI0023F6558E|nr:sensor histidine kinase [Spongiactinospora sp. TRM90649]MDF5759152.1 sensor domain-containing protein [Spongiactinospora sp. TRM90649]
MLPRTALSALTRRPSVFLRSSWPWRSLAYLLLSGIFTVLAAVVLNVAVWFGVPVACGLGLAAVAVLGLPVARFERWRLRLVDQDPVTGPHRRVRGPRAWFTVRLREQATWRDLGFTVVALFALWWIDLGVISLATWVPMLLLSAPLQPGTEAPASVLLAVGGLSLLPLSAYPVAAWAGARAMITRAVLAPGEAEIIRSRARLVDAFEVERRRIERDLHDGAQQRLVALSMRLGLARLDLPPDSAVAAQLAQAHDEAKQALAELRELIRGVHPQVLTDRGLEAAVRDVAGRSPVPVDVDVALPGRLPSLVEVTAYYVAAEAMTNMARHSRARRGAVQGRMVGDTLVLEVRDDGVGGADPESGSGLTGLADRVAVADGVMFLTSPPGGPTALRVEIPCAVSG